MKDKIIASLFVLILLFVYAFLIPPFQNPDEVQHFGTILSLIYPEETYPALEKDILNIMENSYWHRLIGEPYLRIEYKSLKDIRFLRNYRISKNYSNISVFHWLYSLLISPFKDKSLLFLFYASRLISVFFTFSIFLLILIVFKNYSPFIVSGVFAVPQFLIIGSSVNYEVLFTFFGAIFFLSFFSSVKRIKYYHFFLFVFILLTAPFVKKGGWIFWIIFAFGVLLFYSFKKIIRYSLVFSGFVISLLWVVYLYPERFYLPVKNLFYFLVKYSNSANSSAKVVKIGMDKFIILNFKSFFAKFGWMSFGVHNIFYILYFVFIILSLVGIFFFFKNKDEFKTGVFTILLFSLNTYAVWIWYGSHGVYAQGRYYYYLYFLFVCFIVKGLDNLSTSVFKNKNLLLSAFALYNIIINLYIIFLKIIPIFYIKISSPHAGL